MPPSRDGGSLGAAAKRHRFLSGELRRDVPTQPTDRRSLAVDSCRRVVAGAACSTDNSPAPSPGLGRCRSKIRGARTAKLSRAEPRTDKMQRHRTGVSEMPSRGHASAATVRILRRPRRRKVERKKFTPQTDFPGVQFNGGAVGSRREQPRQKRDRASCVGQRLIIGVMCSESASGGGRPPTHNPRLSDDASRRLGSFRVRSSRRNGEPAECGVSSRPSRRDATRYVRFAQRKRCTFAQIDRAVQLHCSGRIVTAAMRRFIHARTVRARS